MNLKWKSLSSVVVAGAALALLASCGGGTQIEAFTPTRIVAFGDEASVINLDGSKYGVNGVEFDTTVTPPVPKTPLTPICTSNQVWVQQLAYGFNLAFKDRCPSTITNANGVMMAAAGAKVADLTAQVDTFLATDSFSSHDLVTIMVGVNDIKDALNAPDPIAAVEAAGTQVGAEVVRITNLGAKVIVSTVPNVGFTPFAIKREATTPGTVAQLADLTKRFNTKLRLKLQDVRDGGHAVGLVLADEIVLNMTLYPVVYGVTNLTEAACLDTAVLPACDVTTVHEAVPATPTYANDWLWADDYRLGPNAQNRIGAAAFARARNNPF
ncbi:MAG: hypothetical protein KF891_16120 [Rhizobacter sp.]|nr:hypothetical protein [Rhizobacter sp.]